MSKRLLNTAIGKIVQRGRLTVIHHDGEENQFGAEAEGFPDVTFRLADATVARDILLAMRLGAGEAYMNGRIVIEHGDIMDLIQLLRSNKPWERSGKFGPPSFSRSLMGKLAFIANSFNRPGSARRNVAHHYDIGNDLYRLMLDQNHMQYSCAYWPRDDMTLEEAQEAKLAHIAAKLALAPGQKVLDIGCGWGGMAIYLARNADVEVLGVTLSQEQLELARERAKAAGVADRAQFELIDYRDLAGQDRKFDRIVSVGMFEHVGRPQFETFFRCCANLMTDDGAMLLHTIGRMSGPGRTEAFIRKYIFPGGYIPALSETLAASQKYRLITTDIETLRVHYGKTVRQWYLRCMANRDKIEAMFDERFFRMWAFYLAGATSVFEYGGMCNYQIQFSRNRYTLPLTRDYIGETERSLVNQSG